MPSEKDKASQVPTTSGPSIRRFLVIYVSVMGLFLILIGYEPIKQVLDLNGVFTRMIVRLSAWLLQPFQIEERITDTSITIRGIQMEVLFGCNGLEAFLIYSVGIIAFPSNIRQKSIGILGGFFVLQVINVLRIASLGLVGAYRPDMFAVFHIYIAQGMMIAVALVLFMIWLHWATRKT